MSSIIKHLVISGGGPTIFKMLGALQILENKKTWNIENIQSIYGTSAGAILGVLICLKFDWETVTTYMLNRPWHEAYPINIQSILDSYSKRGIYDKKVVEIFFKPLFDAKDIKMNITMKEFYEYSKIDLHLFTFEVNEFQMEDISYTTHPDLELLIALQMTSAIPVLISPVCINNKCYMDGGIVTNYPLNNCIEKYKESNAILGFKNVYDIENHSVNNFKIINENTTLLEYIVSFFYKIISRLNTDKQQDKIENEVKIYTELMSISSIRSTLTSIDIRKDLYDSGVKSAEKYLLEHSL